MDTLYQPPFLGEKAAKLAQKTPHCTLSQTEDSGFHVLLWRMEMEMLLLLESDCLGYVYIGHLVG
jgi:hypothetical protein